MRLPGDLQAICLLLVALVSVSCSGTHQRQSMHAEASLAMQIAAVRDGKSDQIQLEHTPLSDDDLQALADLDNLHTLLIDDPDSRITAAGLKHLAGLTNLEHLRLRGEGVDDAALAEIAGFTTLRVLNVPRGSFTDAGLGLLAQLPHLELLRFGKTAVTDAGLKQLGAFPALAQIHLIGVPITDAGLAELAAIEPLKSLYIDDIDLSDAAWDKLFQTRKQMGRPLHVHIDAAHHDRDPGKHSHP
jgi:hypothetical protein